MGNTSSGNQKKAAKSASAVPPRNVLLIGASGTGKTLLLRRLLQRQTAASSVGKDDTTAEDSHAFYCTAPTTGMERISLHCTSSTQTGSVAGQAPPTAVDVTICELGGSMSSTWSQYYKTSQTIIYCVDRSAGAAMKWSTAVVHLNTLLSHADISKETDIIILLHQTSTQRVVARAEVEAALQLSQFVKFAKAGQRVDVVECNASSGDGVEALMKLIAR